MILAGDVTCRETDKTVRQHNGLKGLMAKDGAYWRMCRNQSFDS